MTEAMVAAMAGESAAKPQSRLAMRLDEASAEHAAAVAEVERLAARKVDLAEEISADEALIVGLENAATAAAIEGGTFDTSAIAAAAARVKAKTAALGKVSELESAVIAESRRAAAALEAVQRLAQTKRAADWLGAAAPVLGDLFAAVAAIDPVRELGVADALGDALKNPANGASVVATVRNRLRTRVVNALAPIVPPVPEPPVADTFIKSSRPFGFAYRAQEKISVPAGWVGRVPHVVATRLAKLGAATLLPALVIVETIGDAHGSPIGGGARFRSKRLVPMTHDEATAAISKGIGTPTEIPASDEHFAAKFREEQVFWKGAPIELGVIDDMPSAVGLIADEDGEIGDVDNVPDAAAWSRLGRLALGTSGPPPVLGPVAVSIQPLEPSRPPVAQRDRRRRPGAADPEMPAAIARANDGMRIR